MNNPCIRKGAAAIALLSGLAWISPAVAQQPPQPPQPSPLPTQPLPPPAAPKQPAFMPEVVVTATGYPEEVSKIAGTVQVISQDRIAHSNAKSVTELLAENSVGFMSQWTAGQTSINIRGGATEGQGRDFKSEVLILINSHRAGTANISKLSIADVERVEIVRGPASVVYGSQNMGGVINIILKTGRTAEPGTFIEAAGGSWNYVEGKAAERRQHRHLRLVRRRQRRPAGRLSGGRRTGRVEHRLEPLRRHRRVRLADRPEQSHRHHRTIRRRLRHRLSRLERQHLRQRQSLQRFDRLHLERQDAQRPRSLHVPGLLRL